MIDILSFLFLLFFIAPVSLLFHEIGHVTGAKLVHATSIQLSVGIGKKIWEGSVQNIRVTIRKIFMLNSFTSTTREEPFRKHEKIIISIMGPSFNGILALLLYVMYSALTPSNIVYIFFLFNLWLVIINLLPFKIGQKESDGYTICKLMFKKTR